MRASDRLKKPSRQQRNVVNSSGDGNRRGHGRTAAEPMSPRQPQKPLLAAAAAAAVAASGDFDFEPIRAKFSCPIQPVVEPTGDDSDSSMRTVRFASDRISRDSLADVVWNDSEAAERQISLFHQKRMQAAANNSGGRTVDNERQKNAHVTHVVAKPKRRGSDADVGCSSGHRDRRDRHDNRARQRDGSTESKDSSELLQLLNGHIYGSDCLKVRSQQKLVEASSVSVSASEVRIVNAANAAAAADQSEMMTLTCGDLTKTMMTLLQATSGSRQAGASIKTAAPVTAASVTVAAATTAVTTAAATPVATAAVPDAACAVTAETRRGAGDSHRSKNCSNLSVKGSEAAGVQAVTAAYEEAIPQSDRLVKSSTSGGGVCKCAGGVGDSCAVAGGKRSDITVESTVIVDLIDFASNCGGSDDVCTCDVSRRNRRTRSRFGRLRTPEICKRTSTSRSASAWSSGASAMCTTATVAVAEWDERETPATETSVSERHPIDPSDNEDGTEIGGDGNSRGTSKTTRASQEKRRMAKRLQRVTQELRKKVLDSPQEKMSRSKSRKQKQEKQQVRKEKPKRKPSRGS